MQNKELKAGTTDDERTTTDISTSASLVQNGLLSDAGLNENKLVCEFIGWKIESGMEDEKDPFYNEPYKPGFIPRTILLSKFPFHSSWDWQIPVFGRIAMAVKTLIPKLPNPEKNGKWYFRNLDKYEKATFCNEPLEGFKIIVDLINWYNAEIKSYVGIR